MKKIKLMILPLVLGSSLVTSIPTFADEVSQEQTTLQDIEQENNVQYDGNHDIKERSHAGYRLTKYLENSKYSKFNKHKK